ncbi:TetR/AcrR family transcriptional regulator [Nocardia seriolae]|uniref:TetR/AcrR family transcriptional regulator n=1 Tax=Nocardia seriolae TaxID=37332 RepID=UPI00051A02FF|nr:TetR/AcrR family transcriptional regulator C-terminal domain-containing protein [Nocardia seriolae]WKY54619.1 TetR/AcrR family transcriptional regulator C-terminal domain-containing protein [Nocardia seriolae]BEK86658.1 TetR/AcrR family transcriptional regulator [Nocardia seriolae]GEM23309.1 TetR family transcriptional regulator [Nocardia seriolae NBRC 15557]
MSLIWERDPYRPKSQALSVERIVDASIAIADAEGLEALSMRRVATALCTGTTTLYRYVDSRDDLLDLMADAVQNAHVPLTGDWRTDLEAYAHHERELWLRHPWLAPLLATRPSLGPNGLRGLEHALTAAAPLTTDTAEAASAVGLIRDYVRGAVMRELAEKETQRRTGQSEDQWRAAVAPYLRKIIESGSYPRVARMTESADLSPAEQFSYGLRRLLDGIAAVQQAAK